MGEYFIIVNPIKKQFLDAGRFGEGIKRSGIMRGKHAVAVGLLICDRARSIETNNLIGSWVGDPIIVTGDYAAPNTAGISTTNANNLTRNLYNMAHEEFEDISHLAIDMLISEDSNWADEFANSIKTDKSLLVELGDIVFNLGCQPLKSAIERIIGDNWTKQYKDACRNYPGKRLFSIHNR